MNENLNVTVRIETIVHEGRQYYYSGKQKSLDNSFTVPLIVCDAINYSEIAKAMIKASLEEYKNLKEDEDE